MTNILLTLGAALIGAVGLIIAALIARANQRLDRIDLRIDGIENGYLTYIKKAIEELRIERGLREIEAADRKRVGGRRRDDIPKEKLK